MSTSSESNGTLIAKVGYGPVQGSPSKNEGNGKNCGRSITHSQLASSSPPIIRHPEVEVTVATESDYPGVAKLLQLHLYKRTEQRPVKFQSILDGLKLASGYLQTEFFVARNPHGHAVGTIIAAGYEVSESRAENTLKITALVVHPAFEGFAIARRLHDEIVARAKANGYSSLTLDVHVENARGAAFWRHLGYVCSDYIPMTRSLD